MGDDSGPGDRSERDDLIAGLLRGVGDDAGLTTTGRDRVRAAMWEEFDSIVGETDGESIAGASSAVHITDRQRHRDVDGRMPARARWVTLAAAVALLVVTLAVVENNRRDQPGGVAQQPTTPSLDTLPGVSDATPIVPDDVPVALTDERYRTDQVGDGLTFTGVEGLQLATVEDGVVVVDGDGARLTLFDAPAPSVEAALSDAAADGLVRIDDAQVVLGGRSLGRRDVTVTASGVEAFGCVGQEPCVPVRDAAGASDPALWARSENFLIELRAGDVSTFALVQSTRFGDPFIGRASEIIGSIEFD